MEALSLVQFTLESIAATCTAIKPRRSCLCILSAAVLLRLLCGCYDEVRTPPCTACNTSGYQPHVAVATSRDLNRPSLKRERHRGVSHNATNDSRLSKQPASLAMAQYWIEPCCLTLHRQPDRKRRLRSSSCPSKQAQKTPALS